MTAAISDRIAEIASTFRDKLRSLTGTGLVSFVLGVPPVPASRPRVTRFGGVFYGKPYKHFYDEAQKALTNITAPYTERPVVFAAEFIVEKPKTGKLDYPRGDTDNFVKGPMDAMNNAIDRFWKDDNQVVGLMAFKRYAKPGETACVNIDYVELS